MDAVIVLVVYFVVIAFIVRTIIRRKNGNFTPNVKKASSYVNKANSPVKQNYSQNNNQVRGITSAKEHDHRTNSHNINKDMSKEKSHAGFKDNLYNDWLAKQLREERIAQIRMSDMFDLKAQHHNSCEAEMIRRFHEDKCNANEVDTAKGK